MARTLQQISEFLAQKTPQPLEPLPDDFSPYDAYGGNMDDAFWGGYGRGYEDGKFHMAIALQQFIAEGEIVEVPN